MRWIYLKRFKDREENNEMSYKDKYKSGFTVSFGNRICNEEWILKGKMSNEEKLVFHGYDANLWPLPSLSERPQNEYVDKVKKVALERTIEFDGEVWLDNVRIK